MINHFDLEYPILHRNTYYLQITAHMDLHEDPIITINIYAEDNNDVDNEETTGMLDGSYLYIKEIVSDSDSTGRDRENISIIINGDIINIYRPINEDTNAACILVSEYNSIDYNEFSYATPVRAAAFLYAFDINVLQICIFFSIFCC